MSSSTSSPTTTTKLPPSSLSYREPQKTTVYETGVTLTVDVDHYAEAEKKEAIRLAENKRKLEEMVRAISERANAKLRQEQGLPPQPVVPPAPEEKKGEGCEPETYYSESLGSEFTFPLSKFLSNRQNRNPSFRNSHRTGMYGMYNNPYCHNNREEQQQPPKKMMKFDPPTFQWGIDPKKEEEEKKKKAQEEAAAAEAARKKKELDAYDAHVVPSHVPGVKWSQREIDMLVESSRRWMRDADKNEERYKRNREAVAAAEAAKEKREMDAAAAAREGGQVDMNVGSKPFSLGFMSNGTTPSFQVGSSATSGAAASQAQGTTSKSLPSFSFPSNQPFFPSSQPLLSPQDTLFPLMQSSTSDVKSTNEKKEDDASKVITKRVTIESLDATNTTKDDTSKVADKRVSNLPLSDF
ncbi:hypothetical protein ACHAXN_008115 [Cyclotella atomus]